MEGLVLNGRYKLVARIAAGSMGQVWRCHDEILRRDVAAKLLLTVTPTPEILARFDREARLAGRLACPSIVTVHDYGHADLAGTTTPYLIMELLTGHTLAGVLAGGERPSLEQAVAWTIEVCDALAAAHRAGVVHRDIKPDNVMVTSDGMVKVLDFGIARFAETEATRGGLTATGTFLGTAEYMSPEQAQGRALDARSDLYSVGCLLYALITGRPPFRGDTLAALVFQHVSVTPAVPSALRPDVSRVLDRLIMDLLSKDPGERPTDAVAVRARLASLSRSDLVVSGVVLAGRLHRLGVRLAASGRPDRALRSAAEAVELRRALARADPDRHRSDLAASLRSLGGIHSDVGRGDEALACVWEAVSLYRTLAEGDPDHFDSRLAASLIDVSLICTELGRHGEALPPTREAVGLYRTLAVANPNRYRGDLARALHNLGLAYSELKRGDEALAPTSEAVELYRSLAEADSAEAGSADGDGAGLGVGVGVGGDHDGHDGHDGHLAAALTNLGAGLSDLGRRAEALEPTKEAVDRYRDLAGTDPERYGGDLAGALTNFAFLLFEAGREDQTDQAVSTMQEAVGRYRSLAEADPESYTADLARALTNLGKRFSQLDFHEDAEQAAEEAERVRRRFVENG